MIQVNGDVTFKVNQRGVAALTLGINSLGHVTGSNPLCWSLIPETTEGQVTYTGTWHNVRDSVVLLLNNYRICDDLACATCSMVEDLRSTTEVQLFMETPEFLAGNLIVRGLLNQVMADGR